MYTVYIHTSPEGKHYIGQTDKPLKERWKNGEGYRNNKEFDSDIKRLGWENFAHEILEDNIANKDDALMAERKWILYYKECGEPLYNKHANEFTEQRLYRNYIMCVESGKLYLSGVAAAEDIGVSQQLISYAMCSGNTAKGLHFCRIRMKRSVAEAKMLEQKT